MKRYLIALFCNTLLVAFCVTLIRYTSYIPSIDVDGDQVIYKIWGHTYTQTMDETDLDKMHVCGWPFETHLTTQVCDGPTYWVALIGACMFGMVELYMLVFLTGYCFMKKDEPVHRASIDSDEYVPLPVSFDEA